MRVCDITEKTHLYRHTVSHNLQEMKDAGIIKVRKEGTKKHYYFDAEMASFEKLISMLQRALNISRRCPTGAAAITEAEDKRQKENLFVKSRPLRVG